MKILITNDDGVNAEGLKLLAEACKKYGEVVCIAPFTEQSGKSHSLDIKHNIEFKQVDDIVSGVKTYGCSSTPADCVRIGYYYLNLDFDIVVSGVNNGYNLGEDILYSGTIGAASEAVLCGKKAIAFSTKRHYYTNLLESIDMMLKLVFNKKLLDKCDLWNINICDEAKGIKFSKQGSTHFDAYYEEVAKDMLFARGTPDFSRDKDVINSDVYNVYNHYITITPLVVDRTNFNILNDMNNE